MTTTASAPDRLRLLRADPSRPPLQSRVQRPEQPAKRHEFLPSPQVTQPVLNSLGRPTATPTLLQLSRDRSARQPDPEQHDDEQRRNFIDPAWDFFPFHDRDFTSVAELLLVPDCRPGLFTKQFVEEPPSVAAVRDRRSPIPQNTTPAPADATTLFTGNPPQPNPIPSPSPFYPAGTRTTSPTRPKTRCPSSTRS